jgi:hypothetical protein
MDCKPALGTPRAMKINFLKIKKLKIKTRNEEDTKS